MKIHPHEEVLLEYAVTLDGESDKLLEHLSWCTACRAKLRGYLRRRRPPHRLAPAGGGTMAAQMVRPVDYGPLLRSSTLTAACRFAAFAHERAAAAARLQELAAFAPDWRAAVVLEDVRFHTWGTLHLLLAAARDLATSDPAGAEREAGLALGLAERLEPRREHPDLLADLRARAWGILGNSRRMRSDLAGAEEAFSHGLVELRRGTREPLDRALLLDLQASLRADQRRFAEAVSLLGRAVALFRQVGDDRRAGKSLITLSAVRYDMGEPERGIVLLHQALELIDGEADPWLLLCARHNLVDYLAETGRFREAQRLAAEAQAIYDRFPDPWTQSRRRWVAGKIARGLGRMEEAESQFLAVRESFLEHGSPYDAAVLSLDLAMLYDAQGRTAELERLAETMVPVFASLGIHREALAALSFLCQAITAERVTGEVVAQVASFLKRAQNDPTLRFEHS